MFKWFVSFWSRTSNDSILTMVLATQDLPKNMNLRLYCASLDLLARLGWQKLKIFIFQKFLKKWNFHLSSSTSTGNPTRNWKSKGRPLQKSSIFKFSFLLKIWILQGMQCTIEHILVEIESFEVICIPLIKQGPQMIQFWTS